MPHTIELFMWGFQHHFQIGVKVRAESMFDSLDPALSPRVLLVGILEDDEERHPICIDPEDGEITLADLKNLSSHIQKARERDPESEMIQSHPVAEENRKRRVHRNAIASGVANALNQSREDRRFFASYPQSVNGYLVTTVVHLDREAYHKHRSLTKDKYLHRFTVPTSLLDAAKTVFLNECSRALRDPEPGNGPPFDRPIDGMLRESGRLFMQNPENRLGEAAENTQLFDRFCELSSLQYEGEEGKGRILLSGQNYEGVDVELSFNEQVRFRDIRATRKLLEMASETLDLLATPAGLHGLGAIDDEYDPANESVFEVVFVKQNIWELRHADEPYLWVQDGVPSLPKEPLDRKTFASTVRRVFSSKHEVDIDRLWTAAEAARKQQHGTLLVISSGAEAEAQRLSGQSTLIEPLPLTQEIVSAITAIDGAVLADPSGICYSVGVILDGLATERGDPGRGARYNSALRYVVTSDKEFGYDALALVVSEDGMIDILPDLRPQICDSELETRIQTLRDLATDPNPSRTIFIRVVDWIQDHRFYLNEERCEEISNLSKNIESNWHENNPDAALIKWPIFEEDSEFDASYLKNC